MRLKHAKLLIFVIVLINLILFYNSWKNFMKKTVLVSVEPQESEDKFNSYPQSTDKSFKDKTKNSNKHIKKSITVVFRSFYNFENDLKSSIDNLLEIIPNLPIIILQDGVSYPPINYKVNSSLSAAESPVKFFSLGFDVRKNAKDLAPFAIIKTRYILFMPDSVRISSKSLFQKILKVMNNIPANNNTMIIIPFAGNIKAQSSCVHLNLDFPNWTAEYTVTNSTDKCDLYLQKHAILVGVEALQNMADPFASPFPEMFYIQAKFANISKLIYQNAFQDGKRMFTSYHTKQRKLEMRRKQFKEMYKKLQIKKLIKNSHKNHNIKTETNYYPQFQHNIILDSEFSSSNFSLPPSTEIDYIGCERNTKSCIGPVYNLKPFYVYLQKHTPPCCLEKLKNVFYHVLDEFENVGIRYWLDNYALKSAIETNKLSPDAFDIDISFNSFDLERSNSLKKSQMKPFVDNEGYYWIKATDGHYFRVQFSKINQIGVNLLPFEMSGNEVRPNGFFGWKAHEFSSEFLHPMSSVIFLGKNVMCPNNVREFLKFKNII